MVSLPAGARVENPYYFPQLLKNPGQDKPGPTDYQVLDVLDRKIHKVTVTKKGPEPLQLAGKTYRAIILESLDHDLGFRFRQWINADNGYLLKSQGPRSTQWLADQSIKDKVQRVNIDNHLFAKAGAAISDIPAISHLKVRVKLEPEDFIESDDSLLIQKANELTAGAKDSWEAAKRLSRWVAEEIGYDIPGGVSARNTYDLREGECGAHSRLFAAFCRGVGVPARVVWGCTYVSNLGGSFGQHAWNEVYMGEIGWIPLDTTAREADYADSGHIRLGLLSSAHIALNPKKMEILDFQAGAQSFSGFQGTVDAKKYEPYLGRFKGHRGLIVVSLENGGLSLNLDDKRVFGLREPDEKGEWLFMLSRDIGVTFEPCPSGRMDGLIILNRIRMPKKAEPQDIPANVPENIRPYLGQYSIPMQKEEIKVAYENGHLAVHIPGLGERVIEGPDPQGLWTAKPGDDRFSFVRDDAGNVKTLILVETIRNIRID